MALPSNLSLPEWLGQQPNWWIAAFQRPTLCASSLEHRRRATYWFERA